MIIIFAPSQERAAAAARRRGLRLDRDCILVWNLETIQLTCLQDYTIAPIEEDPLGIPRLLRYQMAQYLAKIQQNPNEGFGWRHYWSLDSNPPEVLE